LAAAPILRAWGAKRPLLHKLAPVLLLVVLAYPLYVTVEDGRSLAQRSKDADHYANAAIWLHDNTEPGARIFQTDWDDFTRLFFYNSQVSYTAGLDPTFFELENESLFETWVSITRGEVDDPGDIIRDEFDSDYIFSDVRHDYFLEQADKDPTLVELYRDDDAVIFAVK